MFAWDWGITQDVFSKSYFKTTSKQKRTRFQSTTETDNNTLSASLSMTSNESTTNTSKTSDRESELNTLTGVACYNTRSKMLARSHEHTIVKPQPLPEPLKTTTTDKQDCNPSNQSNTHVEINKPTNSSKFLPDRTFQNDDRAELRASVASTKPKRVAHHFRSRDLINKKCDERRSTEKACLAYDGSETALESARTTERIHANFMHANFMHA